jgi:hypothetical protein
MNIVVYVCWCPGIFLDFGTEEYSSVIFLGTEKYNKTEEDTLFSCSMC